MKGFWPPLAEIYLGRIGDAVERSQAGMVLQKVMGSKLGVFVSGNKLYLEGLAGMALLGTEYHFAKIGGNSLIPKAVLPS